MAFRAVAMVMSRKPEDRTSRAVVVKTQTPIYLVST
jgi:hypothetical protein